MVCGTTYRLKRPVSLWNVENKAHCLWNGPSLLLLTLYDNFCSTYAATVAIFRHLNRSFTYLMNDLIGIAASGWIGNWLLLTYLLTGAAQEHKRTSQCMTSHVSFTAWFIVFPGETTVAVPSADETTPIPGIGLRDICIYISLFVYHLLPQPFRHFRVLYSTAKQHKFSRI